MSYKNRTLKTRAKEMGLSVSSYARLALMCVVPNKNAKLLDQAIVDIRSNNIEILTPAEFDRQLDSL